MATSFHVDKLDVIFFFNNIVSSQLNRRSWNEKCLIKLKSTLEASSSSRKVSDTRSLTRYGDSLGKRQKGDKKARDERLFPHTQSISAVYLLRGEVFLSKMIYLFFYQGAKGIETRSMSQMEDETGFPPHNLAEEGKKVRSFTIQERNGLDRELERVNARLFLRKECRLWFYLYSAEWRHWLAMWSSLELQSL